jgi:hypothetical protein
MHLLFIYLKKRQQRWSGIDVLTKFHNGCQMVKFSFSILCLIEACSDETCSGIVLGYQHCKQVSSEASSHMPLLTYGNSAQAQDLVNWGYKHASAS